ncbi:MAG: glucosamine-6-phosphate deaminase [Candidatus Firestonebacteria bacterium GWA2_43_8]|nr:MAG: glucosamine-6-phosphate deaminase [Candidatus Firestonebacteria bacterium GWA2_43_8]
MEVIVKNTVEEMSLCGAEVVAEVLKSKSNPVLGLATGSTPVKMYSELIKMNKAGKLDFSKVRTFNLDEYVGLQETHDQSYRYFMNFNLFDQVNIDKKNTNVPSGLAKDIPAACAEYEKKIVAWGGIDIQVLGIGSNGHIAFNEPLSGMNTRTRKVSLTEGTIKDNARFFAKQSDVPTFAVSMGNGTILEARKIVLLANGKNKAAVVAHMIEGAISHMVPASFLQTHADVVVVLDKDAASMLKGKYPSSR